MPPELLLGCCDSVCPSNGLSSYTNHGVLAHGRPKFHPCDSKTHDFRFAILGPLIYSAVAHEINTLEKYFLQKVPIVL